MGDAFEAHGRHPITNLVALTVLCKLLPQCTGAQQQWLLGHFLQLMDHSALNALLCSETELMTHVLDLLLRSGPVETELGAVALRVAVCLAGYHISVANLTKLLLLLEHALSPRAWARYACALATVPPRPKLPPFLFSFLGPDAGLISRDVPFPTRGYTFACKLWMDPDGTPVTDHHNAPRYARGVLLPFTRVAAKVFCSESDSAQKLR